MSKHYECITRCHIIRAHTDYCSVRNSVSEKMAVEEKAEEKMAR